MSTGPGRGLERQRRRPGAQAASFPAVSRREGPGAGAGVPLFLLAGAEHERQAERAADAAIGKQPNGSGVERTATGIQRQCACGGECEECRQTRLLSRAASGGDVSGGAFPAVQTAMGSSGEPLAGAVRGPMESHFGHDLGGVRVHTDAAADASAREVGALAYTVGQDIFFAGGQYHPETPSGQHLLAHELAHTVQQGGTPLPGFSRAGLAPVQPSDGTPVLARQAGSGVTDAPPAGQGGNAPAPDTQTGSGVQDASGQGAPQPDKSVPEPFEGAWLLRDRSAALGGEIQSAEFQWGKDYAGADLPWKTLIQEKLRITALKREKFLIDTFYSSAMGRFLFEGKQLDPPAAQLMAQCHAAAVDETQTLIMLEGSPAPPGTVSDLVSYLLLSRPDLFPDHVVGLYRSAEEEFEVKAKVAGDRANSLVAPLISRPIPDIIPDFVWMLANEYRLQNLAQAVGYLVHLDEDAPVLLEKKDPDSTELGIDDIRVKVNEVETNFSEILNPTLGAELGFLYPILQAYYFSVFYDGLAEQMHLFRIAVEANYERLNEPMSTPDVTLDLQRAYGAQVAAGGLPGNLYFISQLAPEAMKRGYFWIAEQFESVLNPWVTGLAWYDRIWEGFGLYDVAGDMGRALKSLISVKSIAMMVGFTAFMIALQFVPFGNLVADAIMIFLLGKDVIEGLFILGTYFDAAADASTFRSLYAAAQNLAGAGAVAVSLLLQLATLGAGKALGAYLKYNRGLRIKDIDEIADDPAIKEGPPEVQKAVADARAGGKEFSDWEQGLNDDTKSMLDDPANAELRKRWAEMDPAVRRVLSECGSVCIPRNATDAQVGRIKALLDKFGVSAGSPTEVLLKEFFHTRRDVLDRAIGDLENAPDVEALETVARESPVVPPGTPPALAARINLFQARFKLDPAQEAVLREFFEANRADLEGALGRVEKASGVNDLMKRLRVEAEARTPAAPGTPAIPKTKSAYDHAADTHGAARPPKEFMDRAKTMEDPITHTKGNQIGQWYNDQLIVEADQRFPYDGVNRVADVDFGRPVGRVYLPDGRIISDVTNIRIIRYADGSFNNAFPILTQPVYRAYYP